MYTSSFILIEVALPAVFLIALGFVGLVVLGARNWRVSTHELRTRLIATSGGPPPAPVSDLASLPPPVARYLRFALGDEVRAVVRARLTSAGEFRRGEDTDTWIPFKAEQVFTVTRPGFVWDASMRLAPGLAIKVVDAYVDGVGTMKAAVAGLLTVMDEPDTEALRRGELVRWLAETPWLPTALLPGGCVAWTPLDDERARATVRDGSVSVSADFRFGPSGGVVEVFVPDRPREVAEVFLPTPWSGRFNGYEEMDGVRIPREGVVQWHLPGGELPYWKGKITSAVYEVAPGGLEV